MATLRDVLDRRLLIVTGKGGVGRSAVASAIARSRAAAGERVLALAIDRGAGLVAHLGSPRLGHEPTEVERGLYGAVIDPASALEEYVRLQVAAPIALAARVFRVLAVAVPGVRDIVLIGKVWYEATHGEWDAVVVDAAPAGQIQSIIQAPEAIGDLVPRGTVHEQARRMAATLADDAMTALVIVATPEELALTEANEVSEAADASGLSRTRPLVLNRVVEPAAFDSLPNGSGPVRDAAVLQLDVRAAQQQAIAGVEPDFVLPLILGSHSPTDVATRLARELDPE